MATTLEMVSPRESVRSNQRDLPIVRLIEHYQATQPTVFATPGHKRGRAVDQQTLDFLGSRVFEADIWPDFAEFEATRDAAEKLAAEAWGADCAHFLTSGSSSGNHAFLLGFLKPGDQVLVSRNVHQSVMTGLILAGAEPRYLAPVVDESVNLGLGIEPAQVATALDANPGAKLVVVVSPTYAGIGSDLAGIAREAHARGVPLYVDEAWGPHFTFHPRLPVSAMASGADAAVTSIHKLLACLHQGALLMTSGPRIDHGRITAAVRLTQTTSPSLPILASLDASRREMALVGEERMEHALAMADLAADGLRKIPGLQLLDGVRLGWAFVDPTRLLIDVDQLSRTGFEVERILRSSYGISSEMSDLVSIIFVVTMSDTIDDVGRLVKAMTEIARDHLAPAQSRSRSAFRSMGSAISAGVQAMTPREAFFAPSRQVPLADAYGEIAAELVVPYPPGIPALVPGEVISATKVEYLESCRRAGLTISGSADPRLETIRVVAG